MPLPTREELETRYGQMVAEQQAREAAAARQMSQGAGAFVSGVGNEWMDQLRGWRDLAKKGGQIAQNYVNDIAMMRDPTRNLPGRTELAAIGEAATNPQTYIDYGKNLYQQATSGPEGLGRAVGQFVDPFRLPSGVAKRDIFIGKSAKTWNAKAAQHAEELEAAGVDPKTIWQRTGTFRSPDGELRQEISDVDAYLRQEPDINAVIDQRKAQIAAINQQMRQLKENTKTQPDLFPRELNRSIRELSETKKPLLEDIQGNYGLEFGKTGYLGSRARLAISHPEAFEAYPELGQNLIVRRDQPLGSNIRGQYSSDENKIDIGSSLRANPQGASSTAIHELQHAIQQKEGFAKGGNPLQFTTEADKKFQSLKDDLSKALVGNSSSSIHEILDNFDLIDQDQLKTIAKKHQIDGPDALLLTLKVMQNKTTPFEKYRRLAGEAEARAVQRRESFDPQMRRGIFPLESYDVPISELIIKR